MEPITIATIAKGVESLISRVWPDPAKQAEELRKLRELEQAGNLQELNIMMSVLTSQLAINAKEAEHPSVFVAGWRPAVGWTCVLALFYSAFMEPLMRWIAVVLAGYEGPFPIIDSSIIDNILIPLLGLGGLRTWEKIKGVTQTTKTS